jgi:hypothetical protein
LKRERKNPLIGAMLRFFLACSATISNLGLVVLEVGIGGIAVQHVAELVRIRLDELGHVRVVLDAGAVAAVEPGWDGNKPQVSKTGQATKRFLSGKEG